MSFRPTFSLNSSMMFYSNLFTKVANAAFILIAQKTGLPVLGGGCDRMNGLFCRTFFDGKTIIIPIFDGRARVYTFFIGRGVIRGHLGACC